MTEEQVPEQQPLTTEEQAPAQVEAPEENGVADNQDDQMADESVNDENGNQVENGEEEAQPILEQRVEEESKQPILEL